MEEETPWFLLLLLLFSLRTSSSLESSKFIFFFLFFFLLCRGGNFLGKANMGKITRSMATAHKRNPLHLEGDGGGRERGGREGGQESLSILEVMVTDLKDLMTKVLFTA